MVQIKNIPNQSVLQYIAILAADIMQCGSGHKSTCDFAYSTGQFNSIFIQLKFIYLFNIYLFIYLFTTVYLSPDFIFYTYFHHIFITCDQIGTKWGDKVLKKGQVSKETVIC
eukprot:TRINITY_DN17615_c0_g1_i1.p1 TRINITY_DN17615_c0_g1~~TRINITY_DN17615_c0_g1_i1.p1  ORF type:complete len:130 (+),score=0.90 TRINITY_DN17615_c0_g1_i1:55-390(+)